MNRQNREELLQSSVRGMWPGPIGEIYKATGGKPPF
jgi:hypothetical protein